MSPVLIFDLDGTLIDSKRDIADSLNFALAQEGFDTLPASKIEEMVGHGAKTLVRDALGNPSDEALGRVFLSFWNRYHDHLLDETKLYPGVLDFLENYPQITKAVVTNKPELFSQKILEGLGIRSHFRWLIGGDTLPIQKPNPEVFAPIFRELGEPVSGVMVGDSHVDIECGRAAGLKTCAVSYGFRPREELLNYQPDFLIDRFSDFSALPFLQEEGLNS
ncbi:MAG: HAD-IA family hydrolase [Deltaproteobacteria bacterium]|nr:HAD-IA family hydrolase [Deltaproteobacteria bacterium]